MSLYCRIPEADQFRYTTFIGRRSFHLPFCRFLVYPGESMLLDFIFAQVWHIIGKKISSLHMCNIVFQT